jgi:hypothetical protein
VTGSSAVHLTGYHMPMYEGGDQADDDEDDEEDSDSDEELQHIDLDEELSEVGLTPRRAFDEGAREGGAGKKISPTHEYNRQATCMAENRA